MDNYDYVVLECYCFAEGETYPCGNDGCSVYCFQQGGCPYLDYVDISLKDAMRYVPLKYILWNKLIMTAETLLWWFVWQFRWPRKTATKKAVEKMVVTPLVDMGEIEDKRKFNRWKKKVEVAAGAEPNSDAWEN